MSSLHNFTAVFDGGNQEIIGVFEADYTLDIEGMFRKAREEWEAGDKEEDLLDFFQSKYEDQDIVFHYLSDTIYI